MRKDGLLSVFSNSSGYIKVFNLKHKNILKTFRFSEHPIYSVKMSDKKPIIVAADDAGNFKSLDFAAEMDLLSLN